MVQEDRQAARGPAAWLVRALGVLLALIGVILTIGGGWLLALGGSAYYLLVGLAMVASGYLLYRLRPLGAWIYIGVYLATLLWALWEVGLRGWPLVPRVVAPTVLLVLVLLSLPALSPGRRMRRMVLGGFAGLAALILVGWIAIAVANRATVEGELPGAQFAMADPAPFQAGADWPAYGATYAARRYSPLTQITSDNVGRLKRAWVAHTRDLPSEQAKDKYGAETTPLKIGDSLYLCSAKNILIALDPQTGGERWRYDPKVKDQWIPYTAACRGVSYYAVPQADPTQLCATRIIEGTLDGRLIAVDARTGRPCSGFGFNGQVDIKQGMGPVYPGMVSITSPPTIVRGVIVTGQQILDGQNNDAPSGVIQGFDAATGALRWAWDLGRPDRNGPPEPGETYTRGTPNLWTIASADEALGLVYVPLGNSAVDYLSADRSPAENFYATSLVALDATNGRPVWRLQTVHMDVWDYDLGSQATLVDFPTSAGLVPALLLPSKQGEIFVVDRRTGQPLIRVEERPVPQGGVPGEAQLRSRTQPFSTFHTLRKPDLTERSMWGMSPIDQMICRIQFRNGEYKGIYTPPTSDRSWVEYPGYNGGSDWGGIAVDPRRGVIVANYNDMPNYNRLVPRAEADAKGWKTREELGGKLETPPDWGDPQKGAPYAIHVNAGWRMKYTGLLCKEPPYGGLRAIDLRTGKTIWDRPLGEALGNGPFGVPSMLPISIGTPNNGGAVVTAGGLIFVAATTDNMIRAIDLRTGKTLWSDRLPAGGQATPMTYEAGGRQYLVIMAGGHHFMETGVSDEVIAYALPR